MSNTTLSLAEKTKLAHEIMEEMVRDALRYRFLRDEATCTQWERASHATPGGTDAEIDAMMVCK